MKATEIYIAEWRARKTRAGATVMDIARISGLHFNTLYKIFNGITKDFGNKTIIKIESALKELERKKRKRIDI